MKWTLRLTACLVGLALVGVALAGARASQFRLAALAAQAVGDDKSDKADKAKEEAEIKANLAKLSPADRKLAEAQRWCAIEDDTRLGEMGVPFKVVLNGQPVFLCCKGCKKQAEKDPEKTLAKVKELKAKAAKEAKESK
jgi:hypothetical protein